MTVSNPPTASRRRTPVSALVCAGLLALAPALGACGESSNDGGAGAKAPGGFDPAVPSDSQKQGGSLKLLAAEAFSNLDPGAAYSQLDYQIVFATQTPLYYHKPEDPTKAIPELAEGAPRLSADNKTVTVKIKHGVKYGTVAKSTIAGKEVTAADVKYAFERALKPSVANGYFATYFQSIVGADKATGGDIAGITTPDDHTIVFTLSQPFGATVAKALVMPISVPVPESYASRFDAKQPNEYDTKPEQQAFTGPYMIAEYEADKAIKLVRNPNWKRAADSRPAYLDTIDWTSNADPNIAGRQIFDGSGLANGDTPTQAVVKRFATQAKDRISFTSAGSRFVSLNTQKKPFSDVNVRKAVIAAIDRKAMQLTRGGPLAGDVATHFLPPTIAGHEQAGGAEGSRVDYLAKPEGDPAVAAAYMKKAGFAGGRYEGPAIRVFAANDSPAKEAAQVVRGGLESLGFEVRQTSLDQATLYSKFCDVEQQLKKIDVCSNYGWLPDFADPYAMLNANFNGESIVPLNNVNPSLFDDKQINAAMDKGALIADEDERAQAWGEIDRKLVERAAAVPWSWDKGTNVVSKDVHGVVARWNAAWDLSYMSRK